MDRRYQKVDINFVGTVFRVKSRLNCINLYFIGGTFRHLCKINLYRIANGGESKGESENITLIKTDSILIYKLITSFLHIVISMDQDNSPSLMVAEED